MEHMGTMEPPKGSKADMMEDMMEVDFTQQVAQGDQCMGGHAKNVEMEMAAHDITLNMVSGPNGNQGGN